MLKDIFYAKIKIFRKKHREVYYLDDFAQVMVVNTYF